jgi:HK97 family phage major capsid protein
MDLEKISLLRLRRFFDIVGRSECLKKRPVAKKGAREMAISRETCLSQANDLLKSRSFDKAAAAKINCLLKMADAADGGKPSRSKHNQIAYNNSDERSILLNYLAGRKEYRDMMSSTGAYPGSGSGYFSAVGFYPAITAMMKQIDDLFREDVVSVVQTTKNGPYAFPILGDTSTAAVVIAENAPYTNVDANMSAVILPTCPKFGCGWNASIELMQDSGVAFDIWCSAAFSTRLQRGLGAANVTALLAGATKAATAAGNSTNTGGSGTGANSIGTADLLTCISALDAAYLSNASWVMSLGSLTTILGTVSKQGNLVYDIDRDEDGTLMLLGFPVRICPSMPAIATGAKPVVLADLKRFIVREVVNSMTVTPFPERLALSGQLYWRGEWRAQGALLTTNNTPPDPAPAVYIQNA